MKQISLSRAYKIGRKLLDGGDYADGTIDARVLLCHAAGITPEHFYAHREDSLLTQEQWEKYENFLRLRLAQLPVAYITGKKEFMGLEFEVNRSVLIPRPATEILVEKALDWLKEKKIISPIIVDVGCGAGNIAISLVFYHSGAKVYAIDISGEALQVARKNLSRIDSRYPEKKLATRITFIEGDKFSRIPVELKDRVDLVVSNPPYVREDEWASLMDGVRMYEPKVALVPSEGAEVIYTRLARDSRNFLAPGGAVMVEIGASQAEMASCIFNTAEFKQVRVFKDLEGFDRVVKGEKN